MLHAGSQPMGSQVPSHVSGAMRPIETKHLLAKQEKNTCQWHVFWGFHLLLFHTFSGFLCLQSPPDLMIFAAWQWRLWVLKGSFGPRRDWWSVLHRPTAQWYAPGVWWNAVCFCFQARFPSLDFFPSDFKGFSHEPWCPLVLMWQAKTIDLTCLSSKAGDAGFELLLWMCLKMRYTSAIVILSPYY